MAALLLLAGCGSSNPSDSPGTQGGGPQAPLEFLRVSEYTAYVDQAARTFASVPVMVDEFGAISQQWAVGQVAVYWTRQYTLNLLTRLRLLQEEVRKIRPAHPELSSIHAEYEEALKTFQEAFELFLGQLSAADPDVLTEVNEKIVDGNVHLIRFRILLGNLGGREVPF